MDNVVEKIFKDFLNFLSQPVIALINLCPEVDLRIPDNAFNSLSNVLSNVAYIVPVKALMPILICELTFTGFSITYRIFTRIISIVRG